MTGEPEVEYRSRCTICGWQLVHAQGKHPNEPVTFITWETVRGGPRIETIGPAGTGPSPDADVGSQPLSEETVRRVLNAINNDDLFVTEARFEDAVRSAVRNLS